MFSTLCFVSIIFSVYARELFDEEYSKLPKLFHLDNYEECLSIPNGLYCLGTFALIPEKESNETYQLIKEYSKEAYRFNRTLIHRGYCVNTQCPHSGNETWTRNTTLRMEQCVDKLASEYGMRAELHTLHYCRTYEAVQSTSDPDLPQVIYLAIICLVLILNAGGTVYDLMNGDNPKKINVLLCWSICSSWKELTQPYSKSTRMHLAAIQGIRVAVAISICLVHSAIIYYSLYQYNPRVLEKITGDPVTMLIQNSTAMEQMFVVLSSFLCVYSLKRSSKDLTFSFGILIKLLLKRIFRISPLYLLVIGFMATWWPYLNDGPLWPTMAITESKICRDKFLSHALFLNNLMEPEKYCVMPSWYLAVDIQMYIVAVTVTLLLARLRRGRIIVLFICLVASIVLNAVLAYIFDWKPMLYFSTVTEDIRTLFRDVPSFNRLYVSPWGNLPACFIGLIIGHLYPAMINSNFDVNKYKCVLNIAYLILIPALFCWLLLGNFIQHIRDKIFVTVYAAAERSIFQIMCLLIYIMLNVINNFMIRLFAWQGWQAVARLSLSVMLLHWCVNMMLVLPLPQPVPTSAINILTIGAATTSFTFVLALPLTLLVEIPMMKFFHVILSS